MKRSNTSGLSNILLPCIVSFVFCCFVNIVLAQDNSMTAPLNKKIGVYVFPAKNQTAEQTQKDESYCYDWAIKNSGIDPLNMQPVKPDSVKTGPNGAMVAGAAKGAAAGVAIGAIAVAGGLAGRRARKQNEKAQQQQAQANAQAATQAQVENFIKAYKACLTGKGYTVE